MRLLLVDDDPDDLFLLKEALRRHAFEGGVLSASSAAEGLDTAVAMVAREEPPCLVLVDTNMPRMDGLEFVRQLQADPRTAKLRTALMSSTDLFPGREAAIAAGVPFLRKPTTEPEFDKFIGQLKGLLAPSGKPGV